MPWIRLSAKLAVVRTVSHKDQPRMRKLNTFSLILGLWLIPLASQATSPCEPLVLAFESLHLTGIDTLRRDSNGWRLVMPFGNQIIRRANESDLKLLDRAGIDGPNPREVATFRAFRENQLVDFGSIFFGTAEIIDEVDFLRERALFIDRFHARFPDGILNYVEVAHVHVRRDTILDGDFHLSPLSPTDLSTGARLSRELGVPIVVRAVVPNGYTYVSAFQNGQNITFEMAQD